MKNICVIGAGTMGWSIAQVFAAAGYRVILCDREISLAQKGKNAMAKSLERLVQKEKITAQRREEILSNVLPSPEEKAVDCFLMVEAIYESMETKRNLFRRMETILPPEGIMATNTSSLSITQLAACLSDPGRVIGMHFFNPAAVMKLVEVIGGVHTRPQVTDIVMALAEEIGKVPVRVEENAGFVVNRILIPMINEAVCVYSEGVASADDIDTAMRLGANHPMGPLALGDLIGLDVCLAIMEVLHQELGDPKYYPHPLLRKMVRAGMLGKKTGKGFFIYE